LLARDPLARHRLFLEGPDLFAQFGHARVDGGGLGSSLAPLSAKPQQIQRAALSEDGGKTSRNNDAADDQASGAATPSGPALGLRIALELLRVPLDRSGVRAGPHRRFRDRRLAPSPGAVPQPFHRFGILESRLTASSSANSSLLFRGRFHLPAGAP